MNSKLNADLNENIKMFKTVFKNDDDVVYREFVVGENQEFKMALVYIDGLANKNIINENILNSLMLESRQGDPKSSQIGIKIFDIIKQATLSIADIKEVSEISSILDSIMSGLTFLMVDGFDKGMLFETRGWQTRAISPPETEMTIRGSRDSFVETLRINTALVRRRIKDTKFKIKAKKAGVRSKTDIALMYIEDIVDQNVLKMTVERLDTVNIDAILDSGYVEQLIEDCWYSPFPQIEITQRPDKLAAALYEGRVALLIDTTPFALLIPANISLLTQSPEDYYMRWPTATAIRILRFIALVLEIYLPALYIAVTSYNPGMLPTSLALYIAATRVSVPFPAFVEAFLMMIVLEIIREGSIRLPSPVSQTLGIVGAIVIGTAAVQAGIVSPFMVLIVAVTALSSFLISSYNLSLSMRMITFGMMLLATVAGIYGIYIGSIILLSHIVILKSFGVPYVASFMSNTARDLLDIVIKAPLPFMKYRPKFLRQQDKVRMDDDRDEKVNSREVKYDKK